VDDSHGRFVWYELMTTDAASAKAFYGKVMGWAVLDASAPGMPYALFTLGEEPVSGLMSLPPGAATVGARPRWLGYVGVADVDAAAARARSLGGTLLAPPMDVPGISRVSVIADPQTATLALVRGLQPGRLRPTQLGEPGRVGWHELVTADWESALAFYGTLLGWRKTQAEQGAVGTYQTIAIGGETIGGMFTKPASVREPFWLYYFNVADIDAAVDNVIAHGGQVVEGLLEVRGDSCIARCLDPQGAMFALEGKRGRKPAGYFERAETNKPGRGQRWSW
jgi:uncharacterized protein